MRRLLLTSVMILALPAMLVAQRNDIYSSGVTTTTGKVSTSVSAPATAAQPTIASAPVVSNNLTERSIDEYNRRYSYSSAPVYDDVVASDVIYVHDTVFVESPVNENKAYKEGYMDASEDYEFAMRMLRFHSTSRLLNPRYRWVTLSDMLWDPWYDPWYGPTWSLSYSYWDPWYYDPWYYDPWYYDPWYPHYHGYWPGHSHTIIIAGNVSRPIDRFVPNRQLNSRWDRQLAGGSGRLSRGATDRDPVRQSINSRNTANRTTSTSVARTPSGASRNVRVTAPSTSRTSTSRSTATERTADNRTTTVRNNSTDRSSSVSNRATSARI